MSDTKRVLTSEQVDQTIAALRSGVDDVIGVAMFIIGTDPDGGAPVVGGGMAGRFSLKQLEGLHLSFMRGMTRALSQATGLDGHQAEIMLAMAAVQGAEGRYYSSSDGMTDNSYELAKELGVTNEVEDQVKGIIDGLMGTSKPDSKLN